MTSRDDFRSADECPARSYLVMRDEVHSIFPPSSVVYDDQQLETADFSAAEDEVETVEDQQRTVELRQRINSDCRVSPSGVPAKPNSLYSPSSSESWTEERLERARSAVFHTTTNSSPSGCRLSLPGNVDEDQGSLKSRFVCGGMRSSSASSTLFQVPECFSEDQATKTGSDGNGEVPHVTSVMPSFDGPRPAPPPSDALPINRLSISSTNSATAGEASEGPLQQPADTVSMKTSTVQLRTTALQTTDNSENAADVFDDEDEGKN